MNYKKKIPPTGQERAGREGVTADPLAPQGKPTLPRMCPLCYYFALWGLNIQIQDCQKQPTSAWRAQKITCVHDHSGMGSVMQVQAKKIEN